MIDEHFDRNYQAGRDSLNEGIDRLVARIAAGWAGTFRALQRIQFGSPWTARRRQLRTQACGDQA